MSKNTFTPPAGPAQGAAIKGLEQYQKIKQDPSKSYENYLNQQNKNNSIIQSLQSELDKVDPSNPNYNNIKADYDARIESRIKNGEDLQLKLTQARNQYSQDAQASQRKLLSEAQSNPSSILDKAKVGNINKKGLDIDKGAGDLGKYNPASARRVDNISTVSKIKELDAATIDPATISPEILKVLKGLDPAEGDVRKIIKDVQMNPDKLKQLELELEKAELSREAQAATMDPGQLSSLGLEAAQTQSEQIDQNFNRRTLQDRELVDGSSVDMSEVERQTGFDAAKGGPSDEAMVQNRIAGLVEGFDANSPPPWAAGAIRAAQAQMQARGLGSSSMAGQALVQAAIESALPIAQADAQMQGLFERENLSREQQSRMMAAQERAKFLGIKFDQDFQTRVLNASKIEKIADTNFTAEQAIRIENSRLANSVNIANLQAKNAKVLSDSASLASVDLENLRNLQSSISLNTQLSSQIDLANLDATTRKMLSDAQGLTSVQLQNLQNRQTAQIENANNFLEMDLANLSNEQQTELFRYQQRVQGLLSDQSAENAAKNFNAASENQVGQFFADLEARIKQFNSEQTNSIRIVNSNNINDMRKFNNSIRDDRQQFEASNRLIIEQANSLWRQNIRTKEFDSRQDANMQFARDMNGMTASALDNLWQKERDLMAYAFQSTQNAADRDLNILLGDKQIAQSEKEGLGRLAAGLLFGSNGSDGFLGNVWDAIF